MSAALPNYDAHGWYAFVRVSRVQLTLASDSMSSVGVRMCIDIDHATTSI